MPSELRHASLMCSDIDTRSLYKVCEGPDGHLITTNKFNISIFNVGNQRNIKCWSSKSWNPFTCGAVYDSSSKKVICIQDYNSLCLFDYEDDASVKKHKFTSKIHDLHLVNDKIYILFKNGYIEELNSAITTKKRQRIDIIEENDFILDAYICEVSNIFIHVMRNDKSHKLYVLKLSGQIVTENIIDLYNEDSSLSGICFTPQNQIVTFWTNGSLCISLPDNLPGKTILSSIPISPNKPTKICHISNTHIVLFGMDALEEGSCMAMVDTKFGVVTCKKKLKVYRNPPLAWVVSDGIIIVEAGSLSLIPYTVMDSSISTMFSSKLVTDMSEGQRNSYAQDECCSWPIESNDKKVIKLPAQGLHTVYSNVSSDLGEKITSFGAGSLTSNILASETLKLLIAEQNDELINEVFRKFNCIPESSTVSTLNYFLHKVGTCDVEISESSSPLPDKIGVHVNLILCQPFLTQNMLKYLRKIDFQRTLILIRYLHYILDFQKGYEKGDIYVPSIDQACTWFCMVLDANFTQLTMSSESLVESVLKSAFSSISSIEHMLGQVVEIQPLLYKLINERSLLPSSQGKAPYSLERFII